MKIDANGTEIRVMGESVLYQNRDDTEVHMPIQI